MFPVQDLNPTRRMPILTWGLILSQRSRFSLGNEHVT